MSRIWFLATYWCFVGRSFSCTVRAQIFFNVLFSPRGPCWGKLLFELFRHFCSTTHCPFLQRTVDLGSWKHDYSLFQQYVCDKLFGFLHRRFAILEWNIFNNHINICLNVKLSSRSTPILVAILHHPNKNKSKSFWYIVKEWKQLNETHFKIQTFLFVLLLRDCIVFADVVLSQSKIEESVSINVFLQNIIWRMISTSEIFIFNFGGLQCWNPNDSVKRSSSTQALLLLPHSSKTFLR